MKGKEIIPYQPADLSEAIGKVHEIMEKRAQTTVNELEQRLTELYYTITDNDLIEQATNHNCNKTEFYMYFDTEYSYEEKMIYNGKPIKTLERRIKHEKETHNDLTTETIQIETKYNGETFYRIKIENNSLLNYIGKKIPELRKYKIFKPTIKIDGYSIKTFFEKTYKNKKIFKQDIEKLDKYILEELQKRHAKKLEGLI